LDQKEWSILEQTDLPLAVILTALSVEYQAVRAHVSNLCEEVHSEGTIYEQGIFSTSARAWNIVITQIGMGNPGAAFEVERAIQHFCPDVILFVGVAGGLKDVQLGDVVAATKVYAYESGKVKDVFQPRPEVDSVTYPMEQRAKAEANKPDWLQRLQGYPPYRSPRAFVGPIAAGEKVIASTHSAEWKLLQDTYGNALAVDMEGYGFLKAAHANSRVHTLIIRGISDLIDNKQEADAAHFQEIAARHATMACSLFAVIVWILILQEIQPPTDKEYDAWVKARAGAYLREELQKVDQGWRTDEEIERIFIRGFVLKGTKNAQNYRQQDILWKKGEDGIQRYSINVFRYFLPQLHKLVVFVIDINAVNHKDRRAEQSIISTSTLILWESQQ
jgi:nucleoside phosphorylase